MLLDVRLEMHCANRDAYVMVACFVRAASNSLCNQRRSAVLVPVLVVRLQMHCVNRAVLVHACFGFGVGFRVRVRAEVRVCWFSACCSECMCAVQT